MHKVGVRWHPQHGLSRAGRGQLIAKSDIEGRGGLCLVASGDGQCSRGNGTKAVDERAARGPGKQGIDAFERFTGTDNVTGVGSPNDAEGELWNAF